MTNSKPDYSFISEKMMGDGGFYHPTEDTCYRVLTDTIEDVTISITYAGECYAGTPLGHTFYALTASEARFQVMLCKVMCLIFDSQIDITTNWRDDQ